MIILKNINHTEKNLSFNFIYKINNQDVTFFSCNFSMIKNRDGYLVNHRCVNYLTVPTLSFSKINEFLTVNVMIQYDINFNIIKKMVLPVDTQYVNKGNAFVGIEDIRLFQYNNDILFTGAISFDKYKSLKNGVMCGNYSSLFEENTQHTYTTFYNKRKEVEKNWVFCSLNEELKVIYQWYPFTICKLNHIENNKQNELILIKQKNYELLKNMRGSSNGMYYNGEIWFITHVTSEIRSFSHYFVVFDLDLNLLKVSEPFKFENIIREYCICCHFLNDQMIIGYSIEDNSSKIAIYNMIDIYENIKFFYNTS